MPQHPTRQFVSLSLLAAALTCACTDESSTPTQDAGGLPDASVACTVIAPTECPDPPPRYADVEPILKTRCVVCHTGQEASPWPLTTYGHVTDWHNEVRGAVLGCVMPPPEANIPMTDQERSAILTWLLCDYPR